MSGSVLFEKMANIFRYLAIAIVIGMVFCLLALMIDGKSIKSENDKVENDGAVELATIGEDIPGQIINSAVLPGSPAVRSCLSLTGARGTTRLIRKSCDDFTAEFKVVQIVLNPEQCPTDIDQRYFHSDVSKSYGLCLDYNWQRESCIQIHQEFALGVKCDITLTSAEVTTYKPYSIYYNVQEMSVAKCKNHFQLPYPIRKFTVCVEKIN